MHLIYWEHWKYLDTAKNDTLSISGSLNFLIQTSTYISNAMFFTPVCTEMTKKDMLNVNKFLNKMKV